MTNRMMYNSPFGSRYHDANMQWIFSDYHRYMTWHKLWAILAREEANLGAPITQEQIDEIYANTHLINFERVAEIEAEVHHDVVAHLRAFGEQCPKAKPILHLGATSCYITDNADIILQKEALDIVEDRLLGVISSLEKFARKYANLTAVAFTHFQAAQPTTVGKRACLWLQDFNSDLEELVYRREHLKTLGCKGATGNMSGTLALFNGDLTKAKMLDKNICNSIGIESVEISGQTYSRKQDFKVLEVLSQIAQSASKFATDIRLLSGIGEIREGFSEKQVGSSAMPYKKNPITCEKITSLSRYVIVNLQNAAFTAASQWFERTLDDSANRRVVIAEMFLATCEILNSCIEVVGGLVVDEKIIKQHVQDHLDQFKSESIMTKKTVEGRDRQTIHETLRKAFLEDPNKSITEDTNLSSSAYFDVMRYLDNHE